MKIEKDSIMRRNEILLGFFNRDNQRGEVMKGEIDKNWYCSSFDNLAGYCDRDGFYPEKCDSKCIQHHRKWPTPEQFELEYGEEFPDDGAVYTLLEPNLLEEPHWNIKNFSEAKQLKREFENQLKMVKTPRKYYIICACTPWSVPSDDWRPA